LKSLAFSSFEPPASACRPIRSLGPADGAVAAASFLDIYRDGMEKRTKPWSASISVFGDFADRTRRNGILSKKKTNTEAIMRKRSVALPSKRQARILVKDMAVIP
jgi:hypothetical protein